MYHKRRSTGFERLPISPLQCAYLILPVGLIAAIPLINDRYQGMPIALALLQR